ncbi:MAG: hypothetical protein COB88_02530 [Flavobacteriales bacterium]|nr:MAG: hypothetical protein COB88_02530 [Flavobacteriales bacterium]
MLKVIAVFFAITASLAGGCEKKEPNKQESKSCLEKLRAQLESQPARIPAASIWQYTYHDSIVYLVAAPCCDQFNPLYDEDCKIICHPDGGITGKGDRRCTDFHSKATNKKLVWTDPRSGK